MLSLQYPDLDNHNRIRHHLGLGGPNCRSCPGRKGCDHRGARRGGGDGFFQAVEFGVAVLVKTDVDSAFPDKFELDRVVSIPVIRHGLDGKGGVRRECCRECRGEEVVRSGGMCRVTRADMVWAIFFDALDLPPYRISFHH